MLIYLPMIRERDDECEDADSFSDILFETNNDRTTPEATVAVCSLSALHWASRSSESVYRNSASRRIGRKVLTLLSAIIGSRKKAREIIGRVYATLSSITATDGGKNSLVLYCPSTRMTTPPRSRRVECILTTERGGSDGDEGDARVEILRRSPLGNVKRNALAERRRRAFFLAAYDASMRATGDLIKDKMPLNTQYYLLYFSSQDWVSNSKRCIRLVKRINGANVKCLRYI